MALDEVVLEEDEVLEVEKVLEEEEVLEEDSLVLELWSFGTAPSSLILFDEPEWSE